MNSVTPRKRGKEEDCRNYGYHNVAGNSGGSTERNPRTILNIPVHNNDDKIGKWHPTQKPILLMEYFVRTYSNPGDIVLDNVMGSGTTGVASLKSGRGFIGIEKDKNYFKKAEKRIKKCLKGIYK